MKVGEKSENPSILGGISAEAGETISAYHFKTLQLVKIIISKLYNLY